MKKILLIIAYILVFFGAVPAALAAPTTQYFVNVAPFITTTYNNGDASHYWLGLYTQNLYFSSTTNGCAAVNGGIFYITGSSCGAAAVTYPPNSIITSNASGNLIATGTQLTVGNILATTTANNIFLGNILAPLGLVGTPSYSFNGDPNTGIYSQGADSLDFTTGGVWRMGITSSGIVGINTTNPTEVNANSRLTVASLGSTDIVASTTDNTTLSDAIFNSYAPGSRIFMGAHGANQIAAQYGITTGGWGEIGAINSSFGTSNGLMIGTRTTNTPIVFGTNSLERMRILGSGNVGIGTTTPTRPLVIATSTGAQLALSNGTGILQWVFANEGGNLYISPTNVVGTSTTTPPLTINSAGVVGISTANPAAGYALDITGIIQIGSRIDWRAFGTFMSLTGGINFDCNGCTPNVNLNGQTGAGSSGNISIGGVGTTNVMNFRTNATTVRMVITGPGNVGIGTTTPYTISNIETASSTAGTVQSTPFSQLISGTIAGVWYMLQSFDYYGHLYTSGPAPTLSSCGTSPSFVGSANDRNMVVQVGSVAATGCTITFAYPYTTAPRVHVTNRSMSVVNAMTYTVSTTQIVVSQTGLTSAILDISAEGTR